MKRKSFDCKGSRRWEEAEEDGRRRMEAFELKKIRW